MTRASDLARLIGAGATINDGTTITTDDNTPQLKLISTDADANGGPILELKRDSSSPAADDFLGNLDFVGENNANEEVVYGEIFGRIEDVTDGAEDGRVTIKTMRAGSSRSAIDCRIDAIIINDDADDVDFRVESNGNANALVVEGSSSNVGLGTNSPDTKLQIKGSTNSDQLTLGGTDNRGLKISTTNVGGQNDSSVIYDAQDTESSGVNSTHIFKTGGSERMRMNSHGLLINTTATMHSGVECALEVLNHSASGFAARFKGGTTAHEVMAVHNSGTSGTRILIAFKTDGSTGTLVGRITSNGSTVDYATSSDYRLKENVEYNWDATTRLKQLKPARFNWIADESNTTVDGFIAHEVSDIVPEAITGEKDAMTKELLYVDGDEIPDGKKVGDVKEASKIDPQGIDQSKLVPLLVKTIQELEARITALESA
jgi:hypothetical protein